MKMYGKRFLKRRMQRITEGRKETRNAVVYDVDSNARTARVKLQGSSTLVVVGYHENLRQKPECLKPGNAVKILHTGGNGSKLEIVGNSQVIPTLLSTDTTGLPAGSSEDTIISGFALTASSPESMVVRLYTGEYRLNDVIYEIDAYYPMIMDASSTDIMSSTSTIIMSSDDVKLITLDSLETEGNYRYDLIVVGSDEVVDVVKGTEFAHDGTAVMPSTPEGHLLLHYVLVVGGAGVIKNYYIDREWSVPDFSDIEITDFEQVTEIPDIDPDYADAYAELSYDYMVTQLIGGDNMTANVTFQLMDQYYMPLKTELTITITSDEETIEIDTDQYGECTEELMPIPESVSSPTSADSLPFTLTLSDYPEFSKIFYIFVFMVEQAAP